MKFIVALSALALLFALATAQVLNSDQTSHRRSPQNQDALPSSRVQLQGQLGASEDKLDTKFNGWSTYLVTPDNLELSHCSARIADQDQDINLRNRKPQQQSGKILHSYSFYDKNAGTVHLFNLIQQNETDLGTCWALSGDQSSALIEDWQPSQDKCGVNQEGNIMTRKSTFTDAKGEQVVAVYAICLAQKAASLISAEYSINGQVIAVMEANVVRQLPQPDINDRATLLELSVPPACFTGSVRPFDIQEFMDQLVSTQDQGLIAARQ